MLQLTIALTRDVHLEPLLDGFVKPQGIEPNFILGSPGELHYRNLKYDEFDIFQMSISEFLIAKEIGGGSKWDWSGLPVFPTKAFGWLDIFVNNDANVQSFSDLRGKRIGVLDYPMTAALWMRVFLKDLYGIRPEDNFWYSGRTKEMSHAGVLGIDKNPRVANSVQWLTEEQTLDRMLEKGELDAAFGFPPRHEKKGDFGIIDRYGGTPTVGNPRIRKLFPDGGREVIAQYFKQTGVVPVNHLFAAKNEILRRHPWIGIELYKAFKRSVEVAYERARHWRTAYLLFEGEDYKRQAAVFGEDPFPQGVKKNKKMLEILLRGSYEQGLTQRPATVEGTFYGATLDT